VHAQRSGHEPFTWRVNARWVVKWEGEGEGQEWSGGTWELRCRCWQVTYKSGQWAQRVVVWVETAVIFSKSLTGLRRKALHERCSQQGYATLARHNRLEQKTCGGPARRP
jgi:hypothetical protein